MVKLKKIRREEHIAHMEIRVMCRGFCRIGRKEEDHQTCRHMWKEKIKPY
jgi:hypothetical protein